MKKEVDPNDTYVPRELFACGEGHFLTPGFTHWEQGEVCPYGHSDDATNEDVHLYYRTLLVPTLNAKGEDMWKFLTSEGNRGKWGHLPVTR